MRRTGMVSTGKDPFMKYMPLLITFATLIAFGYMEWIALSQWLTGRWYLADVGNIHYCLFNTWHDGFMNSPLIGHNNHFAFHFTPFLVLLSPLVFLSVYPVPLVTTYVLALAFCVPAVYLVARHCGVRPHGAVVLAWLFLSNHFVASLELANHFEVFYVLFGILAISLRATRWFFPLVILALSVKEDAAVWLGGWAGAEWWLAKDPRERRRYQQVVIISICYFVVAMATMLILQYLCGRGAVTDYAGRFRGFGPGRDTFVTFGLLMASFAMLPLFAGWRMLLCLIPLPMLLASFPFMRHLLYYYSYPFLPFLIYTTSLGYRRLDTVLRRRNPALAAVFAVIIFAVGAVQWTLPTGTDGYRRIPFSVTSRDWYRFHLARHVLPPDAPLALQFGLWGITPHRLGTHLLAPDELKPTDWVFMDLQSPHGLKKREDFIAVARHVLADVESGKRKALHMTDDIFIVTPVQR